MNPLRLLRVSNIQLDGVNGFTVLGLEAFADQLGKSLAYADLNQDRVDDLIIGAETSTVGDNDLAERVYVIYGQQGAIPAFFYGEAEDAA